MEASTSKAPSKFDLIAESKLESMLESTVTIVESNLDSSQTEFPQMNSSQTELNRKSPSPAVNSKIEKLKEQLSKAVKSKPGKNI